MIYRNQADAGPAYLVAPGPGGTLPAFAGLHPLTATVRLRSGGPRQWSGSIDSPGGGILVFGTPAFPGWEARLDGQPVPLATIDGVLPAVRVPPGAHQWVYRYAPASVRLGAGLSLAGLGAGLAWLIGFALLDCRRAGSRPPPPFGGLTPGLVRVVAAIARRATIRPLIAYTCRRRWILARRAGTGGVAVKIWLPLSYRLTKFREVPGNCA